MNVLFRRLSIGVVEPASGAAETLDSLYDWLRFAVVSHSCYQSFAMFISTL
jgi:hypothetical protein